MLVFLIARYVHYGEEMTDEFSCGPGEDVRMPHPDHFVHSSGRNDVSTGAVVESIHTLSDAHTSDLSAGKDDIHQYRWLLQIINEVSCGSRDQFCVSITRRWCMGIVTGSGYVCTLCNDHATDLCRIIHRHIKHKCCIRRWLYILLLLCPNIFPYTVKEYTVINFSTTQGFIFLCKKSYCLQEAR